MFLTSPIQEFSKLHVSNVSASSITAPAPTTSTPVAGASGVFDLDAGAQQRGFSSVVLAFYGTRSSADNETFSARITGWRKASTLWVPVPISALSLTQGTSTGISGAVVSNTEYFADTITESTSYTTSVEIVSGADNTIAYVKLDAIGCRYVQVDLAKGTNATCNVLAAQL